MNALLRAGLTIEYLNEFPAAPYQAFPHMSQSDGWRRLPERHGSIAFLFSISAAKAGA